MWSKPRYDELGRVVESYAPAVNGQTGASLGTVEFGISDAAGFVGSYVVAKDASGRKARTISNKFGIIRVDEATAFGGATADADLGSLASPHQPTFYDYNIKGELVKITQGNPNQAGQTVQRRYFMYDSLGRLTRVRQPEQIPNAGLNTTGNPDNNEWTAGYSYDIVGNVLTVTDANGVVITNTYDKAGRVKTRSYTNETGGYTTPPVSYFYDGFTGQNQPPTASPNFAKGALTKVSSSVSENLYTEFDNFGRLKKSQQVTDGNTYEFLYKYNFSGALVEETYPSGRVVRNFLDADGGLAAVSSKAANGQMKTVATAFDYSATGDVKKMMLGNGLWETAQFNERLQLTQLGLGTTPTNNNQFKIDYEYGELDANGTTVDQAKNIGNIAKQTTTIPTTSFVQTFKYDALNRLTEAKEKTGSTQNWRQTFGYDKFGNRTSFTQIVGSTQLQNNNITAPTIDATNNRFTTGQGYVYDYQGNLLQDAQGRTFKFNGDDKQREVRNTANNQIIGEYFYDGDGARVKKIVGGVTTIFVYDAAGDLAAEYSSQAPQQQTSTTSYLTYDHLGSPRVITNQQGQVTSRRDFMPFGEELGVGVGGRSESLKYSVTNADSIRQRFTGYEKDTETDLDFAEARMYQNKHGRFTAVDPPMASASATNPQTFNRYTYTGNNPINYTDPSGLSWCENKSSGAITFTGRNVACNKKSENTLDGTTSGIATGTAPTDTGGRAGPGDTVRWNANGTVTIIPVVGTVTVTVQDTGGSQESAPILGGTVTGEIEQQQSVGTHAKSAFMTFAENNGGSLAYSAGLHEPYNEHTELGQYIGNVASLTQALAEVVFGGMEVVGGVSEATVTAPACASLVGCVAPAAGVAVAVKGLITAGHGLSVGANTIYNIRNNQGATSDSPTIGELRKDGVKDAHHPIQDAAVRDIPGYNTNSAPGVPLKGPSNVRGTPHNLATKVQRQRGGGTYGAERRIGYKALRKGGLSKSEAREAINRADGYFRRLGVNNGTSTRIPGNRRR